MNPSTNFSTARLALPRRGGLTLIEVLVSIFIMAIGILALLKLFPLGALRMDQAIKDERCAEAGMQAIELAKILDLANDPFVRYNLIDPNRPAAAAQDAVGPTVGPSQAVLVDPSGVFQTTQYVDSTQNIARISPACINDQNHPDNRFEFFSILDDVVFAAGAGNPRIFGQNAPPTIGREIRWSWTYLLQRPQVQNPAITNYTVCVYNRRPVVGALEFTLPAATTQHQRRHHRVSRRGSQHDQADRPGHVDHGRDDGEVERGRRPGSSGRDAAADGKFLSHHERSPRDEPNADGARAADADPRLRPAWAGGGRQRQDQVRGLGSERRQHRDSGRARRGDRRRTAR